MILRTDSIGDAVIASGMLEYIKSHYKNPEITILSQNYLSNFYEQCPFVDSIITFEKNQFLENSAYRADFLISLAGREYDLMLNTVYSRDEVCDTIANSILAKQKIAFDGDNSNLEEEIRLQNNSIYNRIIQSPNSIMPEIKRNEHFLQSLGIRDATLEPWIWLSKEDLRFSEDFVANLDNHSTKIVALYGCAQYSIKDYPQLAQVLKLVNLRNSYHFVCLGSEKDWQKHEEICKAANVKYSNLCGQTTIRQAAAIIYKSVAAIGVDTAHAHIATALGIPNLAILGGGHFGRFYPYDRMQTAIINALECYQCNWVCKFDKPHCLTDIQAEDIADAFFEMQKSSDKPRIYLSNASSCDDKTNAELRSFAEQHSINIVKKRIQLSGIATTGKQNLKFSVITPTLNQAKYIEKTILSVLAQDYPNFEHIVIDGGSTDGTQEILRNYPHLKWISEKDSGQTNALNKGLKMASGDIVAWLNSDDYYFDGVFAEVAKFFNKNPNERIVHGNAKLGIEAANQTIDLKHFDYDFDEILQYWYGVTMPTQPAVFFKRELLDENGYFDETLRYAMDFEYWCRISRRNKFNHINKFFSYYLLHSLSKSGESGDWSQFYPEWHQVYTKYKSFSQKIPQQTLLTIFIPFSSKFVTQDNIKDLTKAVSQLGNQRMRDAEIVICTDIDDQLLQDLQSISAIEVRIIQTNDFSKDNLLKLILEKSSGILIHCPDYNFEYIVDWYGQLVHKFLESPDEYNVLSDKNVAGESLYFSRNELLLPNQLVKRSFLKQHLGLEFDKAKSLENEDSLIFSVIIPTYNRIDILEKCLESLSKQDFPTENFEVIIADDGSTDDTEMRVKNFKSKYKIIYLKQANSGPATARNNAIRHASGNYLLILNDDAILEKDVLSGHYRHHKTNRTKLAVMGTFNYPQAEMEKIFTYLAVKSDFIFPASKLVTGGLYNYLYFWTCNISVERSLVDKAGMFDENFREPMAEDIELGLRLQRLGLKVLFDGTIKATHLHDISIDMFIKRQKMWGRNHYKLLLKYPSAANPEILELALDNVDIVIIRNIENVIANKGDEIQRIVELMRRFEFEPFIEGRNYKLNGVVLSKEQFVEAMIGLLSKVNIFYYQMGIYEEYKRLNPAIFESKTEITDFKYEISVIIPTFNRINTLKKCIDALSKQTLSKSKYEVLVIDDGSTDETERVMSEFQTTLNFKYIRQSNAGPGAARNKGIKASQSKYVLIINDDTIASDSLLEEHLLYQQRFSGKKFAVLGTFDYVESAIEHPFTYFLSKYPLIFDYSVMENGKVYGYKHFITCNISIERKALLDAGLFDEDFREPMSEDTELGYRLQKMGYSVLYSSELKSKHDHTLTVENFRKRQVMNGRNTVLLIKKHPEILELEHKIFGFRSLGEKTISQAKAYIAENISVEAEILREVQKVEQFKIKNDAVIFEGKKLDLTTEDLINYFLSKATVLHFVNFYKGLLEGIEKFQSSKLIETKPELAPTAIVENTKSKKILFTMFGWDESGGGTMFPKDTAIALANRGYDVTVFYAGLRHPRNETPYFVESKIVNGVKLVGIFNRKFDFIIPNEPQLEVRDEHILMEFENLVRRLKPDVVHFQNFLGLGFAIAAIPRKYGIRAIYTPHNYHLIDPQLYMFGSNGRKWDNVVFAKNSDLVRTYPHLENEYKKRNKIAIELINDNIDLTLAISGRVKGILVESGLNSNKVIVAHQIPKLYNGKHEQGKTRTSVPVKIGYIGSLIPHKGVHILADAVQSINPEKVNIKIYGTGPGKYIEQIKKIDQNKVCDFKGEYKRENLSQIMSGLDLAVIPSIWEEGAGLVILECQYYGVPVICSRIGGMPEFINENENGMTFQAENVSDLAKILQDLIKSPGKIDFMKMNTNLDRNFEDFIDFLEQTYFEISATMKSFLIKDFLI
ncbi:MAG: glycosyltransferase [Candidatus Kapabacteria bacterium]|nr:glycosyltransferase [Candidatus Kapabacteria bacterium]